MKDKMKGFTLVELLAVIVILAIILVIAVPKVMTIIEDSKKATLETTVKMIASAAEKAKIQNEVLGKTDRITCESVAKINKLDYEDCEVDFEDNTAKVTIKGSGKFAGLSVCSGNKTTATATTEECSVPTTGCDTLYWDGNTEGLVNVGGVLFLVSEQCPTPADMPNGFIERCYSGWEETWSKEHVQEYFDETGVGAFGETVFVIYQDNFVLEDFGTFPKAGIYFVRSEEDGEIEYTTSFTIPGYTGFPHSENCGH